VDESRRERAEEARGQAAQMQNAEARQTMLEIAAMYDRMARNEEAAEEALKSVKKSEPPMGASG
jgi:hypothetical protein